MSFFSLFRGKRTPVSSVQPKAKAKANAANARLNGTLASLEKVSYLELVLDKLLPRPDMKQDLIMDKLLKPDFPWDTELENALTSEQYTRWADALDTYKEDPAKLLIITIVLASLLDIDHGKNRLCRFIYTNKIRSLVQDQLSTRTITKENAKEKRMLVIFSTRMLSYLMNDKDKCPDTNKCEDAAAVITYMMNIVKLYSGNPRILLDALYIVEILMFDCMDTIRALLTPESPNITLLKNVVRVYKEIPDKNENDNNVIKKLEKIIQVAIAEASIDGGRRRTHKKRRAFKKTRRSRK